MVGVVANEPAHDLFEARGEVDPGQPFDPFEAVLDLVVQPERGPWTRLSGSPFNS